MDETYVGGMRRNMSNAKRAELVGTSQGPVGKTAAVGAKDRAAKQMAVEVVKSTDAGTLKDFIKVHTSDSASFYTDDASAYDSQRFDLRTVKHSLSKYVKGDVRTNGIEALWSILKRAHKGTFHNFSPEHLDRYVHEFAGRHNVRDLDSIEQMQSMLGGMEGKRLTHEALTRDNGVAPRARC